MKEEVRVVVGGEEEDGQGSLIVPSASHLILPHMSYITIITLLKKEPPQHSVDLVGQMQETGTPGRDADRLHRG